VTSLLEVRERKLIWWNSRTDSIVWMGEEISNIRIKTPNTYW